MGDDDIRIECLENGYEVEVCDPDIMAANQKSDSKYQSPYRSYAFSTIEEVTTFVQKTLEKLAKTERKKKDGGYAAAFDDAVAKAKS